VARKCTATFVLFAEREYFTGEQGRRIFSASSLEHWKILGGYTLSLISGQQVPSRGSTLARKSAYCFRKTRPASMLFLKRGIKAGDRHER
jgi:hypothetical protein